jgi:hypothetical protein
MNGRHLIACCCLVLALALGGCRQTVVFNPGGTPNDLAKLCVDGLPANVPYELRSPSVIVALDRSSGMNAPLGSMTAVSASLIALNEAALHYQTSVRFGFVEFPRVSFGCSDSYGCCAGQVTIPADYESFKFAANFCDSPTSGCIPSETRPTAAALNACLNAYNGIDPHNRNRYVLLVTNGDPDCAGGGFCSSATSAIGNLRRAIKEEVKTIVVVPGDVIDDQCLQDMALAGGASPNYHWATTPAMLTDVVVGIVRSVATEACRLELGDPIDDFNQVGLFLNNVLVPRGGTDGWVDRDRFSIELRGAACQALLDDPRGRGSLAVYSCTQHP